MITNKKVIIFDLGNVLVKESIVKISPQLGIKNMFILLLQGKLNKMKQLFFDVMEKEDGKGIYSKYPRLFEMWLTNEYTSLEVKNCLTRRVQIDSTINNTQKSFLKNLIDITFTPTKFANIMTLHSGSSLLGEIPFDIPIYLITNYNDESFEELKKKHPILFNRFQDILVSGKIRIMKPTEEIFEIAIEKFELKNVPSKNILFIDDEEDNITTAIKIGFTTIQYKNLNEAREKLFKFLND